MSYDFKKPYYIGLGIPLPVIAMYDANGNKTGNPEVAVSAAIHGGEDKWLACELENSVVIEYHTLH